jgi:predicted kinase
MKVILLSGISGSGKSTYASLLRGHVIRCSADDFFHRNGGYHFDSSQLGRAHGDCLKKFAENLAKPDYVKPEYLVVDNTNLTALELAPYVALAFAYGYVPDLITLMVSHKTGAARNKHGVNEEDCRKMENALLSRELPKYWNLRVQTLDNNKPMEE